MKIKKKNNRKTITKVTLIALIILLVVMVFVIIEKTQITNFLGNQTNNSNTETEDAKIDINPPTQEQIDAGQNQKEESNKPINNALGISITHIDTSSNFISINSVISGAITNNGKCLLRLTQGDYDISKEASTYALPSSSTCMGFDVEKSELSSGVWKVELSVTFNNQISTITDEFVLE